MVGIGVGAVIEGSSHDRKDKKTPTPWGVMPGEVDVIIQSEILKLSMDSKAKAVPEAEIGLGINKNTNKIK